ncbi:MAG: ZIP family metal transporter [Christensenellaceae bacterium]|jgi:ZIP family zinc transporter|nr:ZIP family metal transporter [Christensenellaceae bacterium]
MHQALLWAAGGTAFIFLMTSLGSAMVFLFHNAKSGRAQRAFLGFAAGVMIAASIWSLLIPAIEEAEAMGMPGWVPAASGFVVGALFLFGLDRLISGLQLRSSILGGSTASQRRTTLLISALTIHNIPEGMAVGLAFALAAQHAGSSALYTSAIALALGIGIQNFPEGAAISLPLRQEGMRAGRAFLLGVLSGTVEPVFGMLTVLTIASVESLMPWLLSFAAGAMMYVVVAELIPEAHGEDRGDVTGTAGVMAGFLIMMILDVALG